MIKKQYVKSRNVTKITFELPAQIAAEQVELVADFNSWEPIAFDRLKNGKWKLVQEVAPEQHYQFRYRLVQNGGDHWLTNRETRLTVLRELETFLAEHIGD